MNSNTSNKERALMAITSYRKLDALGVLTEQQRVDIKKSVMDKYGEYLSPIRATLD